MIGTNLDEGTMFAPQYIKDENTLVEYIKAGWIFPRESSNASSMTRKVLSIYPDVPSLGSPYGIEPNSTTNSDDRLFSPLETNQYKRYSSMIGDYIFEGGRRAQSVIASKSGVPVWGYLFEHYPLEPPSPHWGVYHTAEIPYVFGNYTKREDEHGDVSRYLTTAWINFAHDLDPNGLLGKTQDSLLWPRYTVDEPLVMNVRSRERRIIKDDYRANAVDWIGSDPGFNRATRR